MLTNELHMNMLNSPVRTIQGRVSVYDGGTLTHTMDSDDALKSITVERLGDNTKFFGYGIMHKLNFKAIDISREISIAAGSKAVPAFGVNDSFYAPFAPMYVTEVHRDENTNAISVTAYDKLYNATSIPLSRLNLVPPYTIADVASACATALGVTLAGSYVSGPWAWSYEEGANWTEDETVLDVLVRIAEATQTIYYLDRNEKLAFKLLDVDGAAVNTITKERYITLSSKTNRRLSAITNATELGEATTAGTGISGSCQFIRDNPFLDLLDGVTTAERINGAIERIGNLTINQFDCSWRGNYLIEIGDKIDIVNKEGEAVCAYLLDDTIEYDGTLTQKTGWSYESKDGETAATPVTISEKLNQTYAKVDKINNKIELVSTQQTEIREEMSQIQLDSENIVASVSLLQENVEAGDEVLRDEIDSVRDEVAMKISSQELSIAISEELAKGTTKVTTTTGFTFNDEGLTIERSDSEMSTTINEDGMTITRGWEQVLTANNEGVKAEDLHATTYLIIGETSRFEDYKDGTKKRTGCFWIGGK